MRHLFAIVYLLSAIAANGGVLPQLIAKARPVPPPEAPASTTNGMVLWIKFDDASGTTATNVWGAANHGSFGGTGTPRWVTGRIGGGLELDLTNNVAFGNITALEQNASLTVMCWFKPTEATTHGPGEDQKIVQKWSSSSAQAFIVKRDYNESIYGSVKTSTDAGNATVANAAAITTWMHVALVYDGSNVNIYTNGILATSNVAQTGNVSSTSAIIYAGSTAAQANSLPGIIDEFRIYTNALSGATILAIKQEAP